VGIDLTYWNQHQSDVLMLAEEHIRLVLAAMGIALAIAVPLGTLVARFRFLYTPVIGLMGIIYTIPSLALLVYLLAVTGQIGTEPALIALVAYAQFILVRNIAVGLRQVDPVIVDAARGMGMSAWQILFKIEYPLALPVILGGVRVATVATIAIASIAQLVDAGGLGTLLFVGINLGNNSMIEVGAISVSLLAIAADILLRVVDRFLPATRARALAR
jgi:osmoprotectant transport system permease protein